MSHSKPTSRTVSVKMLKWSLAKSIQMGILSRRVFQKEILKNSSRKSTIDAKPRLLIIPESEEGKQLALNASRRSRSTADLYENSGSSSDGETDTEERKTATVPGSLN